MSGDVFSTRLDFLKKQLTADQALLLTNPTDIRYFCGFRSLVPEEREAFLLVTSKLAYLFHASFSPVPETQHLIKVPGTSPQALSKYLQEIQNTTPLKELFADKTRLYANEFEVLLTLKELKVSDLNRRWSWSPRMVKDESEIKAISDASVIAREAFARLHSQLKVGMTELDVQRLLEIEMIKGGSERVAFPTIVCFGPHGALPHHQPTATALKKEMPILIDFGATVNDYRSDMTRSFWFGEKPTEKFLQIEKLVHQAYNASLQILTGRKPKAEFTAAEVDEAARTLISQAGFGKNFIHTTGHGVGIDIHEPPSLNWTNTEQLEPGMVITIEPGIYLDGEFGYRYENSVLITDSGAEELTL